MTDNNLHRDGSDTREQEQERLEREKLSFF